MWSLYRVFRSFSLILGTIALSLSLCAQTNKTKQEKNVVLLRSATLEEILSLRCKAPTLSYELPSTGILSAKGGSTVVVDGDKGVVSVQLHNPTQGRSNINKRDDLERSAVELRVIGRNIYLSQVVDKLEVIDMTGRVVQTHLNTRYTSLVSLRKGTYLLRLLRSKDQIVSKIVLQ